MLIFFLKKIVWRQAARPWVVGLGWLQCLGEGCQLWLPTSQRWWPGRLSFTLKKIKLGVLKLICNIFPFFGNILDFWIVWYFPFLVKVSKSKLAKKIIYYIAHEKFLAIYILPSTPKYCAKMIYNIIITNIIYDQVSNFSSRYNIILNFYEPNFKHFFPI